MVLLLAVSVSPLHMLAMQYLLTVHLFQNVVLAAPHELRAGARAAVVFGAFVLVSPIGLVMALIPRAIYGFYVDAPKRLWGLSALQDQQLAGVLMALEQAVVFFAILAFWFG